MRNWPGPNLGSVFPPSLPLYAPASNATDEPTNQPTFPFFLGRPPIQCRHCLHRRRRRHLIIIRRQKTFLDRQRTEDDAEVERGLPPHARKKESPDRPFGCRVSSSSSILLVQILPPSLYSLSTAPSHLWRRPHLNRGIHRNLNRQKLYHDRKAWRRGREGEGEKRAHPFSERDPDDAHAQSREGRPPI